jgi:hypothetical protein
LVQVEVEIIGEREMCRLCRQVSRIFVNQSYGKGIIANGSEWEKSFQHSSIIGMFFIPLILASSCTTVHNPDDRGSKFL